MCSLICPCFRIEFVAALLKGYGVQVGLSFSSMVILILLRVALGKPNLKSQD
jgi:hypothetical protein